MGKTDLRVLGDTPYNAEPPCLAELTRHAITPLHLVYARNHCMFLPNYATASPISHNAPPDSDSRSLPALKSDDIAFSPQYAKPSDFRSPMLGFTPDAADEMAFVASVAEIKNLASDADTYTVRIDGEMEGMQEKALSVKDMIVYFPRKEVVATLIVRCFCYATRMNTLTIPYSALVTVVQRCKEIPGKQCEVYCGLRVPSRMYAGRVYPYATYWSPQVSRNRRTLKEVSMSASPQMLHRARMTKTMEDLFRLKRSWQKMAMLYLHTR